MKSRDNSPVRIKAPIHQCFGMILEPGLHIINENGGNVWVMEWKKNYVLVVLHILYCPFCGVELRTLK